MKWLRVFLIAVACLSIYGMVMGIYQIFCITILASIIPTFTATFADDKPFVTRKKK